MLATVFALRCTILLWSGDVVLDVDFISEVGLILTVVVDVLGIVLTQVIHLLSEGLVGPFVVHLLLFLGCISHTSCILLVFILIRRKVS